MRTTSVFVVAGLLMATAAAWGTHMMRADYGPLSSSQYAAAVAIAQREVDQEKAHLTSATAVIRTGKVHQPNRAGSCTSGREIRILLIGRFPHIAVSPPPGAPDGRVTSVGITADATSGRACLLGVGTGRADPYRHSADLMPALHR
jgi:hypothetical protein